MASSTILKVFGVTRPGIEHFKHLADETIYTSKLKKN